MIKVKIKKTTNSAKLPAKGNTGDFCHDVWAVSEEEIVLMIGTAIMIPMKRRKAFTPI